MAGNEELLSLRSRNITLRLLDKVKSKEDRTFWVILNTVLPVLIIILAGIFYNIFRKRKYSRP
jgi:ABC-2 type transport system permease protein